MKLLAHAFGSQHELNDLCGLTQTSRTVARAIQQPALEIWKGEETHVSAAQQALIHRARCNRAARRGEYNAAMEKT